MRVMYLKSGKNVSNDRTQPSAQHIFQPDNLVNIDLSPTLPAFTNGIPFKPRPATLLLPKQTFT